MPNPLRQVRVRYLRFIIRWAIVGALLGAVVGAIVILASQAIRQRMGNVALNWSEARPFLLGWLVWGAVCGAGIGYASRLRVVAAELAAKAAESAAASAEIAAVVAENAAAAAKSTAAAAGVAVAEGAPPHVVEATAAIAASDAKAAALAAKTAASARSLAQRFKTRKHFDEVVVRRFLRLSRSAALVAFAVFGCLLFAGPAPYGYLLCFGLIGIAFMTGMMIAVRRNSKNIQTVTAVLYFQAFLVLQGFGFKHNWIHFSQGMIVLVGGFCLSAAICQKQILRYVYGSPTGNPPHNETPG